MTTRIVTTGGHAVAFAEGRIVPPDAPAGRTIEAGDGFILPGLINAHDHLHRNHYPRLGSPPYPDAYAWGEDIHERCAREIARARTLDRHDALLFGALKNIVSGVTTVVHHDRREPLFDGDFPIRVARVRVLHSPGFEPDIPAALAADGAPPGTPLCIHVAEGTNRRAADEVRFLAGAGLLDADLIAVHVVGVDVPGIACLEAAGAAIVWCPTSNRFLLGATPPRALLEADVDVLLGTDSLLTGDGTLLDELRAARATGHVSDGRLMDAVGATAARRLGLAPPSLAPGARADVVVLRTPLFEATVADVALVVAGGRIVLADECIDGALDDGARLQAGGVSKRVPAALAEAAARVCDLEASCARIFA